MHKGKKNLKIQKRCNGTALTRRPSKGFACSDYVCTPRYTASRRTTQTLCTSSEKKIQEEEETLAMMMMMTTKGLKEHNGKGRCGAHDNALPSPLAGAFSPGSGETTATRGSELAARVWPRSQCRGAVRAPHHCPP